MDTNLKQFLGIWQPFQQALLTYLECDLDQMIESESQVSYIGQGEIAEVQTSARLILQHSKQVQCALLDIGEKNLIIEPMYHWNELLINYPHIAEVGFLTPFSYLSHWLSLQHFTQLVKTECFREALFLVERYIILLEFKASQTESFLQRYPQLAL